MQCRDGVQHQKLTWTANKLLGRMRGVIVVVVQDIYIARAEGELQLEEELFYLLLKIYKTPKLLNELTRLSEQQQQQGGS